MDFVDIRIIGLKDIASWFILPKRVGMLVSYCPRGSVAIIGLLGYVHYEIHIALPILSRRIQKVPRSCGGH